MTGLEQPCSGPCLLLARLFFKTWLPCVLTLRFFNFPLYKQKNSIATKSPWEQRCGRTAVSAQGQSLLLVIQPSWLLVEG